MDIHKLFMSLPASKRQRLADGAGTSVAYISKLVRGHGVPSLTMARSIVSAWNRMRLKPKIVERDLLVSRDTKSGS